MGIYVGFDPGGFGAFGWAVASGDSLPLKITGHSLANHAQGAFAAAIECASNAIDGIGIDAPLFWNPAGDRLVDQTVRRAIMQLGSHSATVGAINSLQGACLIQGILVAILCQSELARTIPITESHPKALLWLLGLAAKNRKPDALSFRDLHGYVFSVPSELMSEHERDAALGAVAAFAAHSKKDGWQDLYSREINPVTPLKPPPGYWMPV
jgi:hypothetical protein